MLQESDKIKARAHITPDDVVKGNPRLNFAYVFVSPLSFLWTGRLTFVVASQVRWVCSSLRRPAEYPRFYTTSRLSIKRTNWIKSVPCLSSSHTKIELKMLEIEIRLERKHSCWCCRRAVGFEDHHSNSFDKTFVVESCSGQFPWNNSNRFEFNSNRTNHRGECVECEQLLAHAGLSKLQNVLRVGHHLFCREVGCPDHYRRCREKV